LHADSVIASVAICAEITMLARLRDTKPQV
jgi:hypothetical protein